MRGGDPHGVAHRLTCILHRSHELLTGAQAQGMTSGGGHQGISTRLSVSSPRKTARTTKPARSEYIGKSIADGKGRIFSRISFAGSEQTRGD